MNQKLFDTTVIERAISALSLAKSKTDGRILKLLEDSLKELKDALAKANES